MTDLQIYDILEYAYKRFITDGLIKDGQNVANFLMETIDCDLAMKINLYFASKKQIEKVIKKKFDFLFITFNKS